MAARADLPAGVGVCVCFEGRGGEACSEPTGDVYVLPDSKVAPVHFCWGVSPAPARMIDGRPMAASATGEDVLAAGIVRRIAALCLFLEGAPPAHVQEGSVRCPIRTIELETRAAGGVWPLPRGELTSRLMQMLLDGGDGSGDLIGVTSRAPAASSQASSQASEAGGDDTVGISWLCASARMNALATGSADVLRAEAAWYEGLMEQLNRGQTLRHDDSNAATASVADDAPLDSDATDALPIGWQSSEGWVWMEVLDESISGTTGVLISGVLLTMATLVLFFGDVRLALLTMGCVAILIVIFVGYLASRSYEFGPAEAVAVSIFLGFACDYCVHVAQVHHQASMRLKGELSCASAAVRSGRALTTTIAHTGPALFGAAITTVGSCVPLIACEIQILARLGEYITVCTIFSLGVALTMLAPLLCVAAEGGVRPPRRRGRAAPHLVARSSPAVGSTSTAVKLGPLHSRSFSHRDAQGSKERPSRQRLPLAPPIATDARRPPASRWSDKLPPPSVAYGSPNPSRRWSDRLPPPSRSPPTFNLQEAEVEAALATDAKTRDGGKRHGRRKNEAAHNLQWDHEHDSILSV